MKKQLCKWWLLIPVILVLIFLLFTFWDKIMLYAAPKIVLTSALSDTLSQLQERFDDSPLLILSKHIDQNGRYTAEVNAETENDLLGTVQYDMTLQLDGAAHRVQASGTAISAGREIDLSLYADESFAAVSSEGLVNGKYYGITYDTFASDLRSIPLLWLVVSNDIMTQWEASVKGLRETISKECSLPQLPEISEEEVKKLLLGIAAMPCEIEECSILLEGTAANCHKLEYAFGGEQVGQVLAEMTQRQFGSEVSATISFYLHDRSVVKISALCQDGADAFQYTFDLGTSPLNGPLTLHSWEQMDGNNTEYRISVETQKTEDDYAESLDIQYLGMEKTSNFSAAYIWYPARGKISLGVGNQNIRLKIEEIENGIQLATDDIRPLMQITDQGDYVEGEKSSPISCVMDVQKGSNIETPEYRNLSEWSLEDFIGLLGGVGSLLGIDIGLK